MQSEVQKQRTLRRNRCLRRMWKVPFGRRPTECVACLEDFLDPSVQEGNMMILACDHAIHSNCFVKHAAAYSARRFGNIVTGDELLESIKMHLYGAPGPFCRCERPAAHLMPLRSKFRVEELVRECFEELEADDGGVNEA